MATFERIESVIRGLRRGGPSNTADFNISLNEGNEQIVAMGKLPFAEMTRLGDGWTAQTATPFAPIAAVPSTTARLELFNNSSTRSMVVADLFAFQLLSTAATQTYSVWAQISTSKAAPTNTALVVASTCGKDAHTTTAGSPLLTGVDTTVVANGWRPYGNVQAWGTAAATPGNGWSAEVHGKLIVPPKRSLCIVVAGSIATASSFHCGATFYWDSVTVEGVG